MDPMQFEQIVLNLVINSRDALPEGGDITIETTNTVLEESHGMRHDGIVPGPHVMLAVSDNGHGMDEQTLDRIFQPFFTTKAHGKGTGLGLSVVYGIVRQSGGSVWAYSELHVGTTFKIFLPSVSDAVAVEGPAEMPVARPGGGTILLVEDNEQVREFTSTVLLQRGYEVIEAKNAEDALVIAKRQREHIDLLLTDVILPKMSGKALSDQVRLILPELRVLFVSGYTGTALTQQGILEPGVSFLAKPFSPNSLIRRLAEMLGTGQPEAEL
jgi:CheY-like chemotaxis protein